MLKDLIKPLIPGRRRSQLARLRVQLRRPSAPMRRLPDFLIIGGMRCGTSSLFRYLGSHPGVAPSIRKETEYFSRYFDRGDGRYRAHFPMDLGILGRRTPLSFEATPYYLLHPHAPARAASLVPNAKLIVMLRDPTTRAHSHHQHMYRLGLEDLPFDEAIKREPERTDGQWQLLLRDPNADVLDLHRYSYLRRGRYVEQIRRWLEYFPAENMLFVQFERFFGNPPEEYARVLDFIGVTRFLPAEFRNFSYVSGDQKQKTSKAKVPADIRARLRSISKSPTRSLGN